LLYFSGANPPDGPELAVVVVQIAYTVKVAAPPLALFMSTAQVLLPTG
jgi:hypothetical protein